MDDEARPPLRHVRSGSRDKDEIVDHGDKPLEDRNIVYGFDFSRIKPDRKVEPWRAAILPKRVELGNPGTNRALDIVFAPMLDKLARLIADQEQLARRQFSGDEAREIGADILDEAGLHESTL
jgi:hypothetical protein